MGAIHTHRVRPVYDCSPFANYGPARRIDAPHQRLGSDTRVSPLACLIFTGLPFIDVRQGLKRSVQEYAGMLPEPLMDGCT